MVHEQCPQPRTPQTGQRRPVRTQARQGKNDPFELRSHNWVRKMWLSDKMKKESENVPKLDWQTAKRKEIINGLNISSELMQQLFHKMNERAQTGKGKSVMKFFAYCIAHEAHHRSQIEIAMRTNNCEPDEKSLYHLWEWEKIKT